jgi:hypothetical protein
VLFTTPGAGDFIDNKMTGVTLVSPLAARDIRESFVFFGEILIFFAPLHTVSLSISDLKF